MKKDCPMRCKARSSGGAYTGVSAGFHNKQAATEDWTRVVQGTCWQKHHSDKLPSLDKSPQAIQHASIFAFTIHTFTPSAKRRKIGVLIQSKQEQRGASSKKKRKLTPSPTWATARSSRLGCAIPTKEQTTEGVDRNWLINELSLLCACTK